MIQLPFDAALVPVDGEVCFFINSKINNQSDIQDIIKENPYISPEQVAVLTEEDLATREEKIKVCVKEFSSFKVLKQFKTFIDSSLKLK